jgi:hypothetical protein
MTPDEPHSPAHLRVEHGSLGVEADQRGVRALIALAKKMPHGESARRDAASFATFEVRLFSRGRRMRLRAIWALAGLAACASLALALRVTWPGGEPQLSYLRKPVALTAGDAAAAGAAQELAFSDGSRVQLAAQSEAKVAEVSSHGARVVLAHGRAEVSIARRKNAAWQLVAGPYTVRVTGTAFRMAWSKDQEELEVAMHHGSVVVTGPMAEQGVTLGKGQRLVGSPRSRRLVVEDWPRKQELAPVPPVAESTLASKDPNPRATARSEVLLARGTARFDRTRGLSEHGWAKKVAQGDFAGVLAEARALGHARVLSAATVLDLGALADAARYARQDALGHKTLLALRERFPESELARDSAFLLGRLSRDRRALVWYERYVSEQPRGAYVSQALGRSMMLCYELGDTTRAKALAHDYLTRFPSGPYLASARKLSELPASGLQPGIKRADNAAP